MRDTIVTYSVFNQLLDTEWQKSLEAADLDTLAVATTYGTELPPGRQWGTREQRAQWLACERAKSVRQYAVHRAMELCTDEATLRAWYFVVKQLRPKSRMISNAVREWYEKRSEMSRGCKHDWVPDIAVEEETGFGLNARFRCKKCTAAMSRRYVEEVSDDH
jgi:hypothetical protein